MKRNKFIFVLLLLILLSTVAYGSTFLYLKANNKGTLSSEDTLVIMTSCNPIYIATCNVVGDIEGVVVENLSQPTTGCLHDYTLTTQDMKNLSKADALIINGGGMEGYLDNVMTAYPNLTIIDASADIAYIEDEEADYDEHDHEAADTTVEEADYDQEEHENHDHEHEEDGHHHQVNSHVWLSLSLYQQEVEAIATGLSQIDAEHSLDYKEAATSYNTSLQEALLPQIQALQEKLSNQPVVVLHEAYDYVAVDMGAQVVGTLDLDEERQVSAKEVADIIGTIGDKQVGLVLAEEDYGSDMGDMIMAETSARVVYLNTLIHGSYEADDYSKVMADNYKIILQSLE